MRVAAFDLGTNTVLMLVADVDEGVARKVEDHADIVRLGEGLDGSGALAPAAMERTAASLARLVARAQALGVARALAVGTEALRKASNGAAFVARADEILAPLGGRLEIIDGEREAQLSFRAVGASFPALSGERTVVDIGGGSTEILRGRETARAAVSLAIGSVRLTERCLASDPPSAAERAALRATIDEALRAAPLDGDCGEVVGIAGTVTTLAAMALGMRDYDGDRVHGTRLALADLERMTDALGRTPLADRRRTPGLDPRRADVIYAGAEILLAVLRRARAASVLVSDRGIRWGLVYELTA